MTELSGTLAGVGLPAIMRFLLGLKKTGSLRIADGDWQGELLFEAGQLVGASFGSRTGLAALDGLVQALPEASFSFDTAPLAGERTVELSAEGVQAHLQAVVARVASGAPGLPAINAVPSVFPLAEAAAAEEPMPLDRGTLQTLLVVDGKRTTRQIVAQRGSFDALWQLGSLAEAGLVRMGAVPRQARGPAPLEGAEPPLEHGPIEHLSAAALEPPVAGSSAPARVAAAEPDEADAHCPRLGFEDDPSNSFARPTRLHRCFAAETPLSLSLDQQRELCLSDQFGTCPRLSVARRGAARPVARDGGAPTPVGGVAGKPAWGREGQADAAAAEDPRIVRLPIAARTKPASRRGSNDRHLDAPPSEPSQLFVAGAAPRPADSPRPTSLRGRFERAPGSPTPSASRDSLASDAVARTADTAAATSAAGQPSGSGARPTPRSLSGQASGSSAWQAGAPGLGAEDRSGTWLTAGPGASQDSALGTRREAGDLDNDSVSGNRPAPGGSTRDTRGAGGRHLPGPARRTPNAWLASPALVRLAAVPLPLLVGGSVAVVVVALALLAYLFSPQLSRLFPDDSVDLTGLPNASAVAAGTAVAQVAPRRTPAAAAAPTLEARASPAAAAAPLSSASASPAAAPPVGAQPTPGALLDETFATNAHKWPSDPQGTAWLTDGAYHLAPRQAGQFVALSAPVANVPSDLSVSATFRKLEGTPEGGGFGIIVRDQRTPPLDGAAQGGQYYVLEVGDRGEVGIWRRDTDHWVDILPWQHADAVHPGIATNELTVSAIGARLSMSVNGTPVVTRTEPTLPTGGIGLLVGGDGNHVAVEHLTVQTP